VESRRCVCGENLCAGKRMHAIQLLLLLSYFNIYNCTITFSTIAVNNTHNVCSGRLKHVAILIPVTSRGTNTSEAPLLNFALPTIAKTATANFCISVLIIYDFNDKFYKSHYTRNRIISLYQNMFKTKQVNMLLVESLGNSNVEALNYGCTIGLKLNAMYFFRANDDSQFLQSDWIHILTSALDQNKCLGVAGPLHLNGNTNIFTMDMVCAVHFKIFGYWYDPAFQNWWSDDFITDVYPRQFVYPTFAKIEHILTPTRYKVKIVDRDQYREILLKNRILLCRFLKLQHKCIHSPLGRWAVRHARRNILKRSSKPIRR